jgi:hypothetical protein
LQSCNKLKSLPPRQFLYFTKQEIVFCTVQKRLFRPIRNYLLQNVGLMLLPPPPPPPPLLMMMLTTPIWFSHLILPTHDVAQALKTISTRHEPNTTKITASTKTKTDKINGKRVITFESASPRRLEESLWE